MKKLLTFLKRFEIFIGIFYSVISLIVISGNFAQGNYLNILIYLLVSLGILSIAIGLHLYFHYLAIEIQFDGEDISFYYLKKVKKVKLSQVKNVICTADRYTFLLNDGRKFYVGRYTGGIGVEKQIMPELYVHFDKTKILDKCYNIKKCE